MDAGMDFLISLLICFSILYWVRWGVYLSDNEYKSPLEAILCFIPFYAPIAALVRQIAKQGSKMKTEGLVNRSGESRFPYSRDFEAHISCENKECVCFGFGMCGVPSNCKIDSAGKCKWYLKQLEEQPKKEK
jgi:hypothetical protein